jgi:hypothetical protein
MNRQRPAANRIRPAADSIIGGEAKQSTLHISR